MSEVQELKKTVKQLQSADTEQDILSLLTVLKQHKHVTEAILRESKIGLAVGKLRMHKAKAVADLAKEIVKQWKTAVEKAKLKGSGHAAADSDKKPPATPVTPSGASSSSRSAKTDGFNGSTGDKTRDRCVQMIYDGLSCDSGAPVELISKKAHEVEKAVYTNMGGLTNDYKAKIRSLFVNLKDNSNPGLRVSIVEGIVSPEKFAKMTSQEMASEERKAADKKIEEENLFKSLSAEDKQAETDAFQCSRCKQRKCVYRQQQTRSADEPMTTFVTCTVCKNKWKFC
ncbi:hypothetical protein M413DRAFT_443179 [Hebeloma cylindrosporum]|uniref:Transcription elongation factor n=1 Tax=Hebeloma cylindrosporum TaxID=76867 RepID=A0A0C3CJ86_HEBCY|nr:hypothetical protein M413DRAFT_443179 [Hebeloma cylindrosporum h7]